MKAFFVLGFVAVGVYARSNDGFSSVSRVEDSNGNYQFNYDITDWDTNQKRWEVSDAHNNRKGGYSITDVDGKVRHLEYVADKAGFRAVIRTNEPGTAPGYSGDALYVRDGVKQIITSAQPALQFTGHVIKQKNIAAHAVVPLAPAPVAIAKPVVYQQPIVHQQIVRPVIQHKPIVYQQPIVQTVVQPRPIVYQQPIVQQHLVKPALQVYQNIQPVVHVQPKQQVVYQQQHHHVIQPKQQVVYQQPIVHHQVVQPRPVVYQQPIAHQVIQKPVVYQQPIHYQTYQHIQPVAVAQPQIYVKHAPVVAVKPVVAVQKVHVAPVAIKKIIVTPPPAYSGPRRKPQTYIEDLSQSYITPELPELTPKRVPGYNPGSDDFEDDDYVTVAPPLSRGRVAYGPSFSGITRKSGSFPPLAGPPSRRARA